MTAPWPLFRTHRSDDGQKLTFTISPHTGPELVTANGQPFVAYSVVLFWASAGVDDDGVQLWTLVAQVFDEAGIVRRVHRGTFPDWLRGLLDRVDPAHLPIRPLLREVAR